MSNKDDKYILDVACGGRMFWFNKNNSKVLFCDNRREQHVLCDGRYFNVNPDIVCDFTNLPFCDGKFKLVVYDPPHLVRIGTKSWMCTKYGKLGEDWENTLRQGFHECMRVLEDSGILIFKWNETQISTKEIILIFGQEPLFGHKSGKSSKTHWMCFMKN